METGVGIALRPPQAQLTAHQGRQFCLILVSQAKPEVGTTIFTSPPKAEKEK